MHIALPTSLVLTFVVVGCASTPGAGPQDMSAAQHETTAAREGAGARDHASQYDPAASVTQSECTPQEGAAGPLAPICWESATNPTDEHRRDAAAQMKSAAAHRAAADNLRNAEAKACAGVNPRDRDMSPFYHRESVLRVDALEAPPRNVPGTRDLEGATVIFKPVTGLTTASLQKIVDCHLERNASVGFEMPEMSYCPLSVKGASAKVTAVSDGFAVTIRGANTAASKQIWDRAATLRK